MSDGSEDQGSGGDKELSQDIEQHTIAGEAFKIYGSHAPLNTSMREIRLLSIYPSDDSNALLTGELRVTTINEDYTALSYVWGEWSHRSSIRLNGINTTITTNLAIALRRLRSEGKAINIWTDAVCINQTDHAEKSQQVGMMSDIYRSANRGTIIWLGDEENGSDEAMRFVATANQTAFDNYNSESPSIVWDALRHLLKRAWWKRIWVIQETMLSPNPIMKCGSEETSFENFIEFRNLHWDAEQVDLDRFRPLRNLWSDCPFAPLMWRNWREWVGGTLSSWLVDIANFQCLYQRDKIYALLGLIGRDSKSQIIVGYDSEVRPDRIVFLEATIVCFRETGLLPLQQGQVEKSSVLQLPSWCPDWTSKQVFVPFVGFGFSPFPVTTSYRLPVEKWLFGGERDEKPAFTFSKDKETLFTHGFIVDTVDFVDGIGTAETPEVPNFTGDNEVGRTNSRMKRLETTKMACTRWEQEILDSNKYVYLDESKEAFCRTIIANRDFNKSKLALDVKPIFDSWIGRERLSEGPLAVDPGVQRQIQDYSNSVVSRCAKRTFITTMNGRFGLAPQKTKKGDLVCIFYSGEVAYILRKPAAELGDVPGRYIGEAYIHGIMQGEYLETARDEDFTALWVK